MTKKEGILYADGTFIHLNRWLLAIVIITRDFKRWWRDQTLKFDPTNQIIRLKLWIVCVVILHNIFLFISDKQEVSCLYSGLNKKCIFRLAKA